ncbi:MAG: NhaA family Na+:H+ antiporter [Candidatus Endobugula sp.]
MLGLEVKHECLVGDLSSIRHASLVICMTLGGMLVPTSIYLWVISAGILWADLIFTAASRGWGIPMATDTAFALAILALLGSRASRVTALVLSALAIIDDIGAVVVIGFFTQNRSIRNH